MGKVILFDVDDTLSSEITLGDTIRPLFFPMTTKSVFKRLIAQGDHIIICSSATPRYEIITALAIGADIDVSSIEILGKEETSLLEYGAYGNKVCKALASMEEKGASLVVIVEDDTEINSSHERVVHIQVPYQKNHSEAPSDAYLRAVLLPDKQLLATKSFVQEINQNKQHGIIDSIKLDQYYQSIVHKPEDKDTIGFASWFSWFRRSAPGKSTEINDASLLSQSSK